MIYEETIKNANVAALHFSNISKELIYNELEKLYVKNNREKYIVTNPGNTYPRKSNIENGFL